MMSLLPFWALKLVVTLLSMACRFRNLLDFIKNIKMNKGRAGLEEHAGQ